DGDRGRRLAGADDLPGHLEDLPVQRLVEMAGLEEVGNAIEGLVVDEDGAEQRLFRFDVVRRRAVGAAAFFDLASRQVHVSSCSDPSRSHSGGPAAREASPRPRDGGPTHSTLSTRDANAAAASLPFAAARGSAESGALIF